jgi:hypothetical protein
MVMKITDITITDITITDITITDIAMTIWRRQNLTLGGYGV